MSQQTGRGRSVQIKICGITNLTDALESIDSGANALGFNFYPGSRRFIDIKTAADWMAKIPSVVRRVAVLVNPTLEEALAAVRLPFIDWLQLHGNESEEFCSQLADRGVLFTKALPMGTEGSLPQRTAFSTTSILLDSSTTAGFGGSGQTFPWSLARQFVEAHRDFQVILAGGLTPENVEQAIRVVQPAGVDVTSGVEASFGRKDRARLRAFISAANNA